MTFSEECGSNNSWLTSTNLRLLPTQGTYLSDPILVRNSTHLQCCLGCTHTENTSPHHLEANQETDINNNFIIKQPACFMYCYWKKEKKKDGPNHSFKRLMWLLKLVLVINIPGWWCSSSHKVSNVWLATLLENNTTNNRTITTNVQTMAGATLLKQLQAYDRCYTSEKLERSNYIAYLL